LKIIIEKPLDGEEEHVIIKCHNVSPELLAAINTLKSSVGHLVAYMGNEIYKINPSDVFYIETVDNKTFLYSETNTYETRHKLYEIEELNIKDYLRISKSVIVNLSKIKSLKPSVYSRLEAVLINNERIIISRQYVAVLKKNVGL